MDVPRPPALHCRFFGEPAIGPEVPGRSLGLRRGVGLVAYLAHAQRPVARVQLAGLLWPDADEALARTRLRRLAYRVEEATGRRLFAVDRERVALRPDAVACDSLEFASLARDWIGGHAPLDLALALHWLDRAEPELLSGLEFGSTGFDDWVRGLRVEFRQLRDRLLDRVARALGQQGSHAQALALTDRLLASDPCNEPAHVLRMQLESARGNLAGVEAAFVQCADTLRAEFGIKPAPRTEAAYLEAREEVLRAAARFDSALPAIRFARSAHGAVAFACLGEGPGTLVVCPGFISHIEIAWEQPVVRRTLAALAQHHRVVVFDRRGTGLSERIDANASVGAAVLDVLAILDELGVHDAWLFGASEGGPIALTLAARHPTRVRGLLLFGALAKGCASPDYPWALPAPAYDAWLDALASAWGGPAGIETFAPTAAAHPDLRAWWARMLRHGSTPAGLRRVLGGLRDVDVRPLLGHIRAPALVLHRAGDRAVRMEAGRYLADHIPGAEWRCLPGEDHWWWCGDHEAVLAELLGFLARASRRMGPGPGRG